MPHVHASGFPSPCSDRGGQAPALRCMRQFSQRSRGPVPRAAVKKNAPGSRRARACPSPCPDLIKDRSSGSPEPEQVKIWRSCPTEPRFLFTVGRGPVPRYLPPSAKNARNPETTDVCCSDRRVARDRPSPYGNPRTHRDQEGSPTGAGLVPATLSDLGNTLI